MKTTIELDIDKLLKLLTNNGALPCIALDKFHEIAALLELHEAHDTLYKITHAGTLTTLWYPKEVYIDMKAREKKRKEEIETIYAKMQNKPVLSEKMKALLGNDLRDLL